MAIPEETTVSVIIPCYRSAAFLKDTVSGVQAALSGCGSQIILINDGSPDGTWDVIASLCAGDQSVVGVDLAENAGQSRAKLAAVPFIRGRYAAFMDDDGQHPADRILPMISKLGEGWHMVYAQFPKPKESLWRRFFSSLNNLYVSILTRKPLRLRITSFFVLDEEGLRILRESLPVPFIGGTVLKKTKLVTGFPVEHRARRLGTSAYSVKRLFKHWSVIARSILFPKRASEPAAAVSRVLNAPSVRE